MKDTLFFRQAELLLQVLPYFRTEKELALKGGTAINFFIRDLPRRQPSTLLQFKNSKGS